MSLTSSYSYGYTNKPHSHQQYPIEEDLSDGRSLRDLKSRLEQLSSINSNISLLEGTAKKNEGVSKTAIDYKRTVSQPMYHRKYEESRLANKNEGVSRTAMDHKRTVSQPMYHTKYEESRLANDDEYNYQKKMPESSPALIQKLQSTAKSLHTLQAQSYVLEQSRHDMNGEQIVNKTMELQAELNEVIQVLHKVIAELLVDREQTLKQLRKARRNDFPHDHHKKRKRKEGPPPRALSNCFGISRLLNKMCTKIRGKKKQKPRPSAARYYEDSSYSNDYAASINSSTESEDVPPVRQRQGRRPGYERHVIVKRYDAISRRKNDEISRRRKDEISRRRKDEESRRRNDEESRNYESIYNQQYIKKLSSSQATTSFSKIFKTRRNNSPPTRNLRR